MPRQTTTRKSRGAEPLTQYGAALSLKTCARLRLKSRRRATFPAHQQESRLNSLGRILIVDHDRDQGEQLSHCLQDLSYATVITANLAQARNAILTEGPFKAVVCDFVLPDGNGLQFLSWLRRKRGNRTRFLLINFPGQTSSRETTLNGPHPIN